MARKYIGKTISGGVMALCMLLFLVPQAHSQTQTPGGIRPKMYHISGNIGEAGVVLNGFGITPAPTTDSSGAYDVVVKYGWSGTVTPSKPGYSFTPKQMAYNSVKENKTGQDYTAKLQQYEIAGSVGEGGVTLRGLPNDPNCGPDGRYSVQVDFGWSGTVTPYKEGKRFDPEFKTYDAVSAAKTNENYACSIQKFTITGSAGTAGVTLKGFPGTAPVVSGADGNYRADVPWGWSGTVTPMKEGCEFSPTEIAYQDVKENQADQTYTATIHTFTISGSAGMSGVTIEGLPDSPITGEDGTFSSTVEYGWTGTIKATRLGYTFTPAGIPFTKVTGNQEGQNFKGAIMRYTIQGTVGVVGAKITGFPDEVTSGSGGSYSVTVDYGFQGTITPEKEGFVFDPPSLPIDAVSKNLTKQDFKARELTFTISGSAGAPGVLMQGLPGRVVSGTDGSYTAEVGFKKKITIVPKKDGFTFDPEKLECEAVTEAMAGQNFNAAKKTFTISGRVTSEQGPVPEVMVMTDSADVQAEITDGEGNFQLTVPWGWQGKLTPTKPGVIFTPASKPISAVMANASNNLFTGKVKMVSITDKIVLTVEDGKPPEPIEGVTVTAVPGNTKATTNAQGKYTIQVPYGWNGELRFEKEAFEIEPNSVVYNAVTDIIDKTAGAQPTTRPTTTEPTTTKPTTTEAPTTTEPTTKPTTTEPTTLPAPSPDVAAKKAELERQLRELEKTGILAPAADTSKTSPTGPASQPGDFTIIDEPLVSGDFAGDVIAVLTAVMQKTGARIYVDLTVKPTPIQRATLISVPLSSALEKILNGTTYVARRAADADNAYYYQVFRPVTLSLTGDDFRSALGDLSQAAGVPIIADDSVSGQVSAELTDVPLESALSVLVSSGAYEWKKMPEGYYLVGDRKVDGPSFPKMAETRQIRLNYVTPGTVKAHVSDAFSKYVMVDLDPNSRLVTVTAPSFITERLVKEIQSMDKRPKHVLLDARIVTMERGDLLNIGVSWGMPAAQFGMFGDSWTRGTPEVDTADPAGSWPWAISLGLSFDRTFTNSLTAALNLLKEKNQADIISRPKIVAQDGKRSRIGVNTEERYMMTPPTSGQGLYYMQTQFETITSGTMLEITPHIGDNNDIGLELAVEVSDSIPKARGTDLPVVTRRTAQHAVTVKDGGTALLAGLTENRTRDKDSRVPGFSELPLIGELFKNKSTDKATREVAVFVTATIIPEASSIVAGAAPTGGATFGTDGQIVSGDQASFQRELEQNLAQ